MGPFRPCPPPLELNGRLIIFEGNKFQKSSFFLNGRPLPPNTAEYVQATKAGVCKKNSGQSNFF